MKILFTIALIFLLLVPTYTQQETSVKDGKVEFINLNPESELPFSDAVRVGNLLFLSGAIGVIPGTLYLAPGGIAGETEQALTNIKNKLEKMGTSMSDVVKCTVILADINDWPEMNKIYKTFFSENYPARTSFAGSGLALNSKVEIECIAVIKD